MVDQQPAFARLDGDRTGTNLRALPCAVLKGCRRHDVTMTTPVFEVGRLTIEDVSEGRVPIVAGAAEHSEVAVQLAREEHPITVEGQEGVL